MSAVSPVLRPAWLIPGAGPQERLGSIVMRAACTYRTSAADLLSELASVRDFDSSDIDGAGSHLLQAMARSLNVDAASLWRNRLPDHPRLMEQGARWSACDACWREDDVAGRPRGFRTAWCFSLRTTCPQHGVPLRLAELDRHGAPPKADTIFTWSDELRAWLHCIEAFGQRLENALFDAGPWPTTWRLTALQARSALLAASLNLSDSDATVPLGRITCLSFLRGHVYELRRQQSPLRQDPWSAWRAIADPRTRRTALWLVAWLSCPGLPEAWSPGFYATELSALQPEGRVSVRQYANAVMRGLTLGRPTRGGTRHRKVTQPAISHASRRVFSGRASSDHLHPH